MYLISNAESSFLLIVSEGHVWRYNIIENMARNTQKVSCQFYGVVIILLWETNHEISWMILTLASKDLFSIH